MSAMASQITGVPIVCWTVYSSTDQRKHQISASLTFVKGIHRWPMGSPHKGPVTRKMFPFDYDIMCKWVCCDLYCRSHISRFCWIHAVNLPIFLMVAALPEDCQIEYVWCSANDVFLNNMDKSTGILPQQNMTKHEPYPYSQDVLVCTRWWYAALLTWPNVWVYGKPCLSCNGHMYKFCWNMDHCISISPFPKRSRIILVLNICNSYTWRKTKCGMPVYLGYTSRTYIPLIMFVEFIYFKVYVHAWPWIINSSIKETRGKENYFDGYDHLWPCTSLFV